ncbi:hypothetical protein [Accumulibacter sp.]|uniref:hypothetical protein n=1 Tax=Accumulibacter sp. TaxID=2053492 RepID=UPI0028C3CCF2|nr:hypothetical protein [Accumulibacter sp.]
MTTSTASTRQRKAHPLADPRLQIALVWVGAFLVGWPLIQISGARGAIAMFLYVFVIWGVLVGLIFAVSRSLRRSLPPATSGDEPEDER